MVTSCLVAGCAASTPHSPQRGDLRPFAGIYFRGFFGSGVDTILYEDGRIIRVRKGALWIGKVADPDLARVRNAAGSPVFASGVVVEVATRTRLSRGVAFLAIRGVGSVAVSDGMLSPAGDTNALALATREAIPVPAAAMSDVLLFSALRDIRVFPVGAALVRRTGAASCKPRDEECEVPSWIRSDGWALLDDERVLELRSLAAHCEAVESHECTWPIRMRYCVPGESELFPESLTGKDAMCP